MKPLLIILAATVLATTTALGQTDLSRPDSASGNGSLRDRFSLDVGLSAGATLYSGAYSLSPYYSKYGFTLQIPIMLHYELAPHWRVSSGLRYDFNWDPLYNGVTPVFSDGFQTSGLTFNDSPYVGKQHAHIFHGYLGIPLRFTWYPRTDNKRLFALSFDCYAAYAVTQYFNIHSSQISIHQNSFGSDEVVESGEAGYYGGNSSMNPWKLELGVMLSTDYLGIIHGLRFFANLLPQYTDPRNNEKIYNIGMTLFL